MPAMNTELLRFSPRRRVPNLPAILAFTALAAATVFHSIDALAATGMQRCMAADGIPVYTDKACAALGARRVPIPGELLARIAREEAAFDAAAESGFDGTMRRTSTAVARRTPASGCARSPTQLSMDLQGAWALGDVNRVAESYHWVGLGHHQAHRVMQRLDRLSAKPLVQAEYFNAQIGSGPMQLAGSSHDGARLAGIMQLMFGEGSARGVQDFDVRRYGGCYFIEF